jgi:TPR repeat protein
MGGSGEGSCQCECESIRTGSKKGITMSGKILWFLGLSITTLVQTACSPRACDKGDANACIALGESLSGSSLPENTAQAVQIFQEACEADGAKACDDLLRMCIEGKCTDNDSKVFHLFEKACERGLAPGCADLGVMYGRGKGVRKDPDKAAESFNKACDGGSAVGCSYVGEWYSTAGVRAGWNCGRPAFCTFLGDAADAVPKDDVKAFQFYTSALFGTDPPVLSKSDPGTLS